MSDWFLGGRAAFARVVGYVLGVLVVLATIENLDDPQCDGCSVVAGYATLLALVAIGGLIAGVEVAIARRRRSAEPPHWPGEDWYA